MLVNREGEREGVCHLTERLHGGLGRVIPAAAEANPAILSCPVLPSVNLRVKPTPPTFASPSPTLSPSNPPSPLSPSPGQGTDPSRNTALYPPHNRSTVTQHAPTPLRQSRGNLFCDGRTPHSNPPPACPRNGPQRAPRPTAQRVWRTARGDGTSSHRRSPAPPLRRRERRRPDVTLWAHEATA